MHHAGDAHVLLAYGFAAVEHDENDVRTAYGGYRAQNAVTLHALVLYAALAAHARRVYQRVFRAVIRERRVYRVASRPGYVRNRVCG